MGDVGTLDELARAYDLILVDNCATKPYGSHLFLGRSGKLNENCYVDMRRFGDFCNGYELKFRFTPMVFGEVKKKVRNVRRWFGFKETGLSSALVRSGLQPDGFIRMVEGKDRVVGLGNRQKVMYDNASRTYLSLIKEFKLNEPDFEFLLFGFVLSHEKSVALLSNDHGIYEACVKLSDREDLTFEKFGFFVREWFPEVTEGSIFFS